MSRTCRVRYVERENKSKSKIRRPPCSDINTNEFKVTKELFDEVMALDKSLFDANEVDVEQHVPFNSSCYPDGANASLYMRSPSSPPRNCTHDRKHQKRKGSHSRRTKPNKLKLILPLPDCKLNYVHHSLKYDKEQSRANKSSAGSNHISSKKHHNVCHLNPTIVTRRTAVTMKKKKRRGVVKSVSVSPTKSKSKFHKQQVSPTLLVQKAYSVQVKKKKQLFDMMDEIPEAKTIIAWKLVCQSKEKESMFVPNKLPSKPVNPSMFYNPFKFKQGRCREPKNDNQRTKKKEKG